MSTEAWTTVCSASADNILGYPLREVSLAGLSKQGWPSKFILKPNYTLFI